MPDWHNEANGVYGKKVQKEFWDKYNENREMDKHEYKYITSTTDKEKPFYPGLMRNADR